MRQCLVQLRGERSADQLIAKPASIAFGQAASLLVGADTAYSALRQMEGGPGDAVLIHGGGRGRHRRGADRP
jgi:NADPH:quinone reductase-like Zn-dependent oxidoreductase